MNLSFKKTAATMLVAAGALAGVAVVSAPAASAAAPICNTAVDTYGGSTYDRYQPFSSRAGTWNCEMYSGHGGSAAVAALQNALNVCNGKHLAVDGSYGPATAEAVRQVNGQNGVYGPNTRGKMRWPIYDSRTDAFKSCSYTG